MATAMESKKTPRSTNASVALALPILPGKTPSVKAAFDASANARHAEYVASRKRAGLTRDLAWLQSTPVGDFLVRYVEAPDAHDALRRAATADDAFSAWVHGQLRSALAVTPMQLPQPKLIVDFDVGGEGHPVAFVVPIIPGKEADNLAFARTLDLADHRYAELVERATVVRERVWQYESPQGSFSVMFFEARDPGQAFATWGGADTPFARSMRASILDIHGVDFAQPAAPPEPLIAWTSGRA